MGKPVVVLAGQSNAARLSSEVIQLLDMRYGVGNYVLVRAYAAGAPLTRAREELEDWATPSELREEMLSETIAALTDNAGSYLAGTIWLQGEADTYAISPAETYAGEFREVFETFHADLRSALGQRDVGAESARVMIANLSQNAPDAPARANWEAIRNTFQALDDAESWVTTLDPDDIAEAFGVTGAQMFSDGLHYSDSFSLTLAQALIEALLSDRSGTSGADIFEAQFGVDRMTGGAGNDIYNVDHIGDQVIEQQDQGLDEVISLVSFSLRLHSQYIENLTLTGSENIYGTGNGLNNVVRGNAGDNLLNGAWGNDMLFGGDGDDTVSDDRGADQMFGGAGDDTFYVDNFGDRVFETAGQGFDRVIASVSFSLQSHSDHLETLILDGAGDIYANGNSQANLIEGNAGSNRLNGAWGNDTLRGGAGNDIFQDDQGDDRMEGGTGSDLFIFRGAFGRDIIEDFDPAQSGEAIDLTGASAITDYADLTTHHLHQNGSNAVIDAGGGNQITLIGINASMLSEDDFLF